jgi:hypothetical protein
MLLVTREGAGGRWGWVLHSFMFPLQSTLVGGFFFLLGLGFRVPFSPPYFGCFVLLTFGKFSSHCVSFHTLDISESSPWVRVQRLGLRLFRALVWKLLIVEPFFQWKLSKIETQHYIGIWGCSWCCQKAFDKTDLMEFIPQFSELRCERNLFWSEFSCWIFKQIANIGFERKIQLSPQCVHTSANITGFTSLILFYNWGSKEVLLLEVQYVPKKLVMGQSIWLKWPCTSGRT